MTRRTVATSYAPEDVTLLLQPVAIAPTGVAEKERLIQTGARHYSEMLSEESAPTPAYLDIYRRALAANGARMAAEAMALATGIARQIAGPVTLVSLVRAGLPVGVLLTRALRAMGREAAHYGVSIIRDRGIDSRAMERIVAAHGTAGLVFVDGWTGKGAIAGELARSWPGARLAVLSDIGGFAWLAASRDDWLIPSGILGGVVSGLVSRSVLNEAVRASGGYHGAAELTHLAAHDLSRAFVDEIWALAVPAAAAEPLSAAAATARRERVRAVVGRLAALHGIDNLNRIKPGIAEAARAILRRRPERVYLADADSPELAALRHLIERDGLDHRIDPDLTGPYRAVTLIARTS